MTPLFWRLEPAWGIELAGHSGPSDWILGWPWIATITAGVTVALSVDDAPWTAASPRGEAAPVLTDRDVALRGAIAAAPTARPSSQESNEFPERRCVQSASV